MQTIPVKRLREEAKLPVRATEAAAGADLYACLDSPIDLGPGETVMIPTGLAFEIPPGWVGLVFARSSLGTRQGLAPANKVGVIDADYRGEVLVSLLNHSSQTRTIEPGDRIAQLVITPCMEACYTWAEELSDTARGTGGFGSTGRA